VAADRAQLHLVCGHSWADCATEIVAAEEYGQHAVDERALLHLLQRLFGVEGQSVRSEGRGQPIRLGSTSGGECEVWAWLRPSEPAFANWIGDLETRARGKHRARVLVPTPRRIYSHTFERYGPGQPVEVVHLDQALTIVGREIVPSPSRGRHGTRVPWADAVVVARPGARLRVAAGVRWSHITIEYVNDDTVAVRVGARSPVRISSADLGLRADSGAAAKRPQPWELLLALCAGNGSCSRGSVGAPDLGALRTRATRLSKLLCAVFGIADAPLHVDGRSQSVRADFLALPETRRERSRRERADR
jgi:hypothetical protein